MNFVRFLPITVLLFSLADVFLQAQDMPLPLLSMHVNTHISTHNSARPLNTATQDTVRSAAPFNQDSALKSLVVSLAGREQKPAEEVFKNIKLLKGMPAARLLKVMEYGYARSLGVTCNHCHNLPKNGKATKSPQSR